MLFFVLWSGISGAIFCALVGNFLCSGREFLVLFFVLWSEISGAVFCAVVTCFFLVVEFSKLDN